MFEKRSSNFIMKSQKTGKCKEIAKEHMINRDYYLKQLIEKKHSSKIKIVTGMSTTNRVIASVAIQNKLFKIGQNLIQHRQGHY